LSVPEGCDEIGTGGEISDGWDGEVGGWKRHVGLRQDLLQFIIDSGSEIVEALW
jgi:hypothetical protein